VDIYIYIYMDKLHILAIAIGVLIVVGFFYSRIGYPTTTTTTTTTRAVAVRQPVVVVTEAPRYGYVPPPPPRYNPYTNQYYY